MPLFSPPYATSRHAIRTWLRALCASLIAMPAVAGFPARAQKAEIWLTPLTPNYYQKVDPSFGSDFARMFGPDAPWQRAAERTKVIKLGTMFAFRAPDELLAPMLADLKRRNIALAIEGLMLTGSPPPDSCGRGIEGYTGPTTLLQAVEKIKRLGGELRFIAMDEPLYFGHFYQGLNACRTPLDQLAKQVADRIRQLRQVFPNLAVGDIEPFGGPQRAGWNDLLMQWAEVYRTALGEPMPFLHLDVQWQHPYRAQMRDLAGRLRKAGIRMGIIYNGDTTDTAAQWTARATDRFVEVEADPALVPDQAIFQIWSNPKPPLNLPDTDPTTMTGLVSRYAAEQTSLTLTRTGRGVTGRLIAGGRPVAGVPVTLYTVDREAARIVEEQTLRGRVPANAVEAAVALRLNAECGCSAAADIAVGRLHYREDAAGTDVTRWFRNPVQGQLDRFTVSAGQRVSLATARFPVMADDRFTLGVPLAATAGSADAGYIAVIFFGADGKEVRRARMPIAPGAHAAATVTTRADGSLSFQPPADADAADPTFRARFAGDAQYRPSWASTP